MASAGVLLFVAAVCALAGCGTEGQPEVGVDNSASDLRGPPANNAANLSAALEQPVTGPITVTSGQSIRLSAVQPVLGRTPGSLPPDPCRVELSFADTAGRTLASSRVVVAAGAEQHLDFSPTVPPSTNAALVHATLVPTIAPVLPLGRGREAACLYSVQVLDALTGKASVVSAPKLHAFEGGDLLRELEANARPAAAEFGFVTLARGQTARLNLVNRSGLPGLPPDPCRASIAFVDASGVRLTEAQVALSPHEGTTLELSGDKTGATGFATIRPVISGIGGVGLPPDPCRFASLELIEDATGASSLHQDAVLIRGERDNQLSAPVCTTPTTSGVCAPVRN